MNSSNIKRYGGVTVFIVAVVICALFFVQVLALMQGYSDNISDQAVERARFLTRKQADALKNKYTELKLKTELFAEGMNGYGEEKVADFLTSGDLSRFFDDESFVDMLYYKDGSLYLYTGELAGDYAELNALVGSTHCVASRLFQYANRVMSFGLYCPVQNSEVQAVVALYDYIGVSLAACLPKTDETVTLAQFVLLCKQDGRVIDKYITNSDMSEFVVNETVQKGLLSTMVSDQTAYKTLIDLVNNGENGAQVVRIQTEEYAVVVDNIGAENSGLFLLNMYKLSDVCGRGFEMMSQIVVTLAGLCCMIAALCLFFFINKRATDKLLYNVEMVNADLDCSTPKKFDHDVGDLMRRHKTSKFALVSAQINNFNYIEERFGDSVAHGLLSHMRNVCQNAVLLGETYSYTGDGEFNLLVNYKNRKELESRLSAIYRTTSDFEEFAEGEYTITMTFCVYEIDRAADKTVRQMRDKLRLVQRSALLRNGTFSINYYGDVTDRDYFKRAEIEGRMENALENSEFHLFYQPKFNLHRNDMDGSEILVRWFDPKIGSYRQPGEFLPVFEENGFISKLDRFVFFRACQNIAESAAAHKRTYPVSVNVSRVTAIQSDFLDYYKRIKAKFNIPDKFVTLEFTESFAFENYEYLSRIINELHQAGFLCSLDDFGTGYSSYNVLKTLDMDEIKLDKFFLERGSDAERDRLLLSGTIDIVKRMNIKVTQEGVETKDDYERLVALGCDVIQGFYFSKPMKYVDYREFVKQNFGE